MNTDKKIENLRELMKEKGISCYIVNTSDPHMSEYLPAHYKTREWISGFTGSQGTFVTTMDKSALWVDGRYFIQAEKQIEGTEIALMKIGMEGVPKIGEWIKNELEDGDTLGLNGRLFSHSGAMTLRKDLGENIKMISTDLISPIWNERPQLPMSKAFILDEKYSGRSAKEKLSDVRDEMKMMGADYYLLASLDDINWLYNIRGRDVKNNPVVISYALIKQDTAILYVDERKITDEVRECLENNGVEIRKYREVFKDLGELTEGAVVFDGDKVNHSLVAHISKEVKRLNEKDIVEQLKCIKNSTEIENQYEAYIKDGVALTRLFMYLESEVANGTIDEGVASDKLFELRSLDSDFVEDSFDSISAYAENGAMMHYNHINGEPKKIEEKSFHLLDSGGQYPQGTTDITRTVAFGTLSDEEKTDYTLVLQSMIRLSMVKFIEGTTGAVLDGAARFNMWQRGMDYKCGTGHGVGYFLNVHEGPQRIHHGVRESYPFSPGMMVSNEPGVYKEGKYGIRIENVMVCKEDMKTPDGNFYSFDTLTRVYIDTSPVIKEMLSEMEIEWLNNYNNKVYEDLAPYLNDEEKEFLRTKTQTI